MEKLQYEPSKPYTLLIKELFDKVNEIVEELTQNGGEADELPESRLD